MKIRAFWDITPCSLVVVDRRFRGAYCLHHKDDVFITQMMEAVRTSETSVCYNETTRRNRPENKTIILNVVLYECGFWSSTLATRTQRSIGVVSTPASYWRSSVEIRARRPPVLIGVSWFSPVLHHNAGTVPCCCCCYGVRLWLWNWGADGLIVYPLLTIHEWIFSNGGMILTGGNKMT
jgi:hypothetical protein